jgi:hypothetical protein
VDCARTIARRQWIENLFCALLMKSRKKLLSQVGIPLDEKSKAGRAKIKLK